MCRTLVPVNREMPVTQALSQLIQSSFPEEYEARRQESLLTAEAQAGKEPPLSIFVMSNIFPGKQLIQTMMCVHLRGGISWLRRKICILDLLLQTWQQWLPLIMCGEASVADFVSGINASAFAIKILGSSCGPCCGVHISWLSTDCISSKLSSLIRFH